MNKIEELIKLHDEIQLEHAKEFVKDKKCICCKTTILKPLYPPEEITLNPLEQERGPWDGGIVTLISGGYGSRHDLESYYIAICDSCLSKLKEEGIAESYRNLKKTITGNDSLKRVSDYRKNL